MQLLTIACNEPCSGHNSSAASTSSAERCKLPSEAHQALDYGVLQRRWPLAAWVLPVVQMGTSEGTGGDQMAC